MERPHSGTKMKWKTVKGNLSTPLGFRLAAAPAGIKKVEGALDLALIFSDSPKTSAAGVFTTNRVAAAPVVLSRHNLKRSRGTCRAIVANSGNANACTGSAGSGVAEATARAAAELLGISPAQVIVASTGVIGRPLDAKLILNQLPGLAKRLSANNSTDVARAIMTTDTIVKRVVLRAVLDGHPVHIAGVAKGAGMIHPRMATMLCFITTDAEVAPLDLQSYLRSSVDVSFNRITVDGDTSTNDTVVALASGRAGVAVRRRTQAASIFLAGLTEVCQTLAKLVVKDGEGASKLVSVEVNGAKTAADADRIARSIANSPLVKTALAGADPNWGRIICAAGYSGAVFDPSKVDILIDGFPLCKAGLDSGFNEKAAKRVLSRYELTLRVNLHQGKGAARIWTCDFTHEYIDINASYRT